MVQVLVSGGRVGSQTLETLAAHDAVRGVYLRHIDRAGQAIPISRRTVVEPGDGGLFVTMLPLLAGLVFGKYVLRVNPLLLLGAIAGSQTFTPALAALQERSPSPVAVLGYSGTVAVGNVLLTMWGTVIVLLLA